MDIPTTHPETSKKKKPTERCLNCKIFFEISKFSSLASCSSMFQAQRENTEKRNTKQSSQTSFQQMQKSIMIHLEIALIRKYRCSYKNGKRPTVDCDLNYRFMLLKFRKLDAQIGTNFIRERFHINQKLVSNHANKNKGSARGP